MKVTGYDAFGKKVGKDKSNAFFDIVVLKIASPAGGEQWTSGETVMVTWLTGQTKKEVAKVQVLYTKNGGKNWKKIAIFKQHSNPGVFLWKIPDVNESKTQCKIKVKLIGGGGGLLGKDESEGFFTIFSAP